MAYSAEVIQKARQQLAQAKADRESEELRRQALAYERLPRLKQIDLELRQSMVQAAKTAYSGGAEVRAAMEQVKQENLALQQERQALICAHFGEGYLDQQPICQRCGGSGYMGSSMCQCLEELCRAEQRRALQLIGGGKETFQQFRLDYYSDIYDPTYKTTPRAIMARNLDICRSYAATFCEGAGNLLLVGGTGLGKTFLSACIARTVTDRGYSVCYETASRLFGKLERARFSNDEAARKETAVYQDCDLLVIDDLGTEMPGQFVTAALYSILNERLMSGKAMVVSTNLNIDEAKVRYSPQIASRLQGSFTLLPFVGDDIRVRQGR